MMYIHMILLLVTLLAGYIRCSEKCGCKYHEGGCSMYVAAPKGFKCLCRYVGAWTCKEGIVACQNNEHCPGNLADYCACTLGGGNCGAYKNPPALEFCKASSNTEIAVPAEATCTCRYLPGGCVIREAAPFGWKCVCVYKGAWTCTGWPQQCSRNEICLGDNYSYCGCKQGGGDCGGYEESSQCPSYEISRTCSCKKTGDWNKGYFDITEVNYITHKAKFDNLQLIALAEQFVPNNSSETQTVSFRVSESISLESSFSHTMGLEIQVGTEFKAGIPLVGDATTTITFTTSYSHTYGESKTITKEIDQSFTCNGAPHTITKCTVTMQKVRMTIPYTMTFRHKVIPDCTCESQGIYTGIQAYNATLKAQQEGAMLKNGIWSIFSEKHRESSQKLMLLCLALVNIAL